MKEQFYTKTISIVLFLATIPLGLKWIAVSKGISSLITWIFSAAYIKRVLGIGIVASQECSALTIAVHRHSLMGKPEVASSNFPSRNRCRKLWLIGSGKELSRLMNARESSPGLRKISREKLPPNISRREWPVKQLIFRGLPPPNIAKKGRLANMIFVARLDDNKNLAFILRHYGELRHLIGQFTIVGDGDLREIFEQIATNYDNIVMTGNLSNRTTQILIGAHDCLVLPSKYDGWGAVVNEALSVGTRVVCSDACGAEVLLDGVMRGESLPVHDLADGLKRWLSKGPIVASSRAEIKQWAMTRISGKVASDYFVTAFSSASTHSLWTWVGRQ